MCNNELVKKLAVNGGEKAVKTPIPPRGHFGQEEKDACVRVMDDAIKRGVAPGYNGPERELLSKEFAALLGGGYAESVSSGTASVYVALRSQNIQPFTEIICGPITDAGGFMPITMMNCIPVVADCIPDSFNISIEGVKKAYTERTSAILVAHIAGEPCEDIEKICEFAKEKGIAVIEDCSQCHGSRIFGKIIGTFGDASAFSMMNAKQTCAGGQGGLVWTRTEEAYYRARQATDRGKPYGVKGVASTTQGNVCASLNYNMDDMHVAIARVQIQKQFKVSKARRDVVNKLKDGLKNNLAVRFPELSETSEPSYFFIRAIFNADAVTVDKDTFQQAMLAEGIPSMATYPQSPFIYDWYKNSAVFGDSKYPWAAPEYKGDKEKRYTFDDVPYAKKAIEDTIVVYFHESWKDENINEIISAFNKVYEAYKK